MIQRGQLHQIRNVRDHRPKRRRGPVESRMRRAYHAHSALDAEAQLLALAQELDRTHPGAAGSLPEGRTETLTILRLDVPPWPAPGAPPTPSRACSRSAGSTRRTSPARSAGP